MMIKYTIIGNKEINNKDCCKQLNEIFNDVFFKQLDKLLDEEKEFDDKKRNVRKRNKRTK
jgi:hypothetical protein|tara:strand:- start:402 stop:581 length:180 start_codon:yes stop_codon:yes gene_type:complete